ncbi:hypothetical protein [Microbacterium sp.]|uniref:hypothetical protein n=1 Tax=Microbacterium sp. TaxID=51671 RepID=UPI003C74E02C
MADNALMLPALSPVPRAIFAAAIILLQLLMVFDGSLPSWALVSTDPFLALPFEHVLSQLMLVLVLPLALALSWVLAVRLPRPGGVSGVSRRGDHHLACAAASILLGSRSTGGP